METKKYIIEIPDNTAWLQWVKVSDKDGHVCFDFKDPEDLTPYTELDLDAVRNEAYEKGVQDTKQYWVDAPRSFAYKLGYENGLNAAWEVVKKLEQMDTDTSESITGQFGLHNIMHNLTASEVIEKIRQYEQDKKQINVWDEVQHKSCNSIKIIVLNKESDVITGIAIEDVPYACKVGDMYISRDVKDWEKTGKHYEIAEVLRKLREKEL